jgi:Ni/Co efflux regulator RcnB
MRSLLCAAAALALLAPAAAVAQPQHGRHDNRAAHQDRQRGAHQDRQRAARQDRRANRVRDTRAANRTHITNKVVVRPTVRTNRVTRQVVYRPGHRPASFHRIHANAFRYPSGYRYRRWNVGLNLPRVFLSNSYYWNDWRSLGLLPPPPGYVWVRFGPDLLLVNRFTGRIADVIYGAFY